MWERERGGGIERREERREGEGEGERDGNACSISIVNITTGVSNVALLVQMIFIDTRIMAMDTPKLLDLDCSF